MVDYLIKTMTYARDANTLDEAMAASRAEYERWKHGHG
jgi:hypothetical protein